MFSFKKINGSVVSPQQTKAFIMPEGRFYYAPTVVRKKHYKPGILSILLICSVFVVLLPSLRGTFTSFSWHDSTAVAGEIKTRTQDCVSAHKKNPIVSSLASVARMDDVHLNEYLEKALPGKL